ncbi:uncharacterized protein LOC131952854 [Physella acuta]|uniref:uncharacterized protein LOC131952854 n=1 Tax=Physella acuta TaxID=109671 RepID=UPI0027DE5DF4|nr:uncharacterized protein LOC131952854 [Physella acuta]
MDEEYDSSHTIVKNTENLLQEKSLLDFTVHVEDVDLPCHRVILAASSNFFRALLLSDMKEAKEGRVTISGISYETFQLILKSIYNGKIDLTLDNFKNVWQAADQLQVDFIVAHCEDFAAKAITVENFESIVITATCFKSEKLLKATKKFLFDNFDTMSELNVRPIMELELNEFNEWIDARDLKVRNEDWLIKTVLKWVEYVPDKTQSKDKEEDNTDPQQTTEKENQVDNESEICLLRDEKGDLKGNPSKRTQALTTLLKSVRTCLVSTPLLKHLLKHRLIINNTEARDVLIDAVLYKTTHYNHGQWRTSAIHRASSEWEHCGVVYIKNNEFLIISAFDFTMYTCVKNSDISLDVTLVVFDSCLYAAGVKEDTETNSCLCVLSGKAWSKIAEIPARHLILVAYEHCIFILNKTTTEIYQIFPKCGNPKVEEFTKLPETFKVQQAINYQRMILIFSSVTVNDEEKTAVHQLDILTKKFTELEQLNGPAEQITSFSDDNYTYVLQTNGNVWIVDRQVGNVTFKALGSLWNTPKILYGALTSGPKLIISHQGESKVQSENLNEFTPPLGGYFNQVSYWSEVDVPCSNFIPVVLLKSELLPI